jgi:hypothetical protein
VLKVSVDPPSDPEGWQGEIHGRLSRQPSWKLIQREAMWELLDALYADEHKSIVCVVGPHSHRRNLRAGLVLRWWRKYLSHPDLTEEGRIALVTGVVQTYAIAAQQLEIVKRHRIGESQRALATEYNMSQSAISRLCSPLEIPEEGGFTLSPKIAEAILREVRSNGEVLARIEQRLESRESLRELEAYLAGVAEARQGQEEAA